MELDVPGRRGTGKPGKTHLGEVVSGDLQREGLCGDMALDCKDWRVAVMQAPATSVSMENSC